MTIPRWLTSLLCTRSALRPRRALLTPTWLAALAVLGVNDHLLKGAGVLPGVVTGKLSDIAGMIVAPALLAALLGLRSRRGLLFCHVAVGAVFAAINVSPAAADAWTWLMSLVGANWVITVDPTDLLTLPALALGWRALVPAMQRPLAPALTSGFAPRLAQMSAIVAGTSLSVATSDTDDDGGPGEGEAEVGDWGEEEGDWGEETVGPDIEYMDIDADAYLHNGSTVDIVVRTRDLRPDVQLDCIAVEDDPGLLLSEPLFGAGRTWTMPPTTNAAARDLALPQRDCYAVLVEGDRLADPFILFWQANDLPVRLTAGDIDDASQHTEGGVLLGADADGTVSVSSSQSPIVYAVDPVPPADAYYPGLDVERVAWSDVPQSSEAMQITKLEVGPDGCLAIEFDDTAIFSRWYLCLPADSFPFAETNWIRLETHADGDVLEFLRVAGTDDPEPPSIAMVVSRGRSLPTLTDTEMAGKALFDVAVAPEEICGTVARPSEVKIRYGAEGEVMTALPGDTLALQGDSTTLTVWLAHAEERIVLDPTCAEGPDELGTDYEIVAVRAPSAP